MLLIVDDAYFKWIEVYAVIECGDAVFARFGLPNTLVSDNGLCFVSAEYEEFLEWNGIRHVTASAYHLASNRLAE